MEHTTIKKLDIRFFNLRKYLRVCDACYYSVIDVIHPKNDYLFRLKSGDVGDRISAVMDTIDNNDNMALYYIVWYLFNRLTYVSVGHKQFKKHVETFKQVENPDEELRLYLDENVKEFDTHLQLCLDIVEQMKKEVKEKEYD